MSFGATLITLTILVCTFTFPYALKFINSEGWIWWVWSQVFWSIFCNVKDWTLTCFTLNIPSPHWSSLVFHSSLSSKTRGSSSCEEPCPLTGSKTCTLEHPDKWMLKRREKKCCEYILRHFKTINTHRTPPRCKLQAAFPSGRLVFWCQPWDSQGQEQGYRLLPHVEDSQQIQQH